LQLEQIFFEFRELARGGHAFAINHEGRQYLHVPVRTGVQVEHEIDQGSLQPCPCTTVKGKTCAGQLGAALEIKDSQLLTDLPVGLGREAVLARLTPGPYLN